MKASMATLAPGDIDRIEAAVASIERRTCAEVIVTLTHRSGSYRDADLLAGFTVALLGLAVMFHAPFHFSPVVALADTMLLFILGSLVPSRLPGLRRLFTTKRRLAHQVRRAAMAAFVEEGVSHTKGRTGILFFISLFEGAVEILPDVAIEGKVADAHWHELRSAMEAELRRPGGLGAIVPHLEKGGDILAGAFPVCGENPDEIPNRPRVRPA